MQSTSTQKTLLIKKTYLYRRGVKIRKITKSFRISRFWYLRIRTKRSFSAPRFSAILNHHALLQAVSAWNGLLPLVRRDTNREGDMRWATWWVVTWHVVFFWTWKGTALNHSVSGGGQLQRWLLLNILPLEKDSVVVDPCRFIKKKKVDWTFTTTGRQMLCPWPFRQVLSDSSSLMHAFSTSAAECDANFEATWRVEPDPAPASDCRYTRELLHKRDQFCAHSWSRLTPTSNAQVDRLQFCALTPISYSKGTWCSGTSESVSGSHSDISSMGSPNSAS